MVETRTARDGGRDLPRWIPDGVRHYLNHTERGVSIRALSRYSDCHPSTVLRQVRKLEMQRDDLLVDEALRDLAGRLGRSGPGSGGTSVPDAAAASAGTPPSGTPSTSHRHLPDTSSDIASGAAPGAEAGAECGHSSEQRKDPPLMSFERKSQDPSHPVAAPAVAGDDPLPDDETLTAEALRVLRRLAESGAVLAVASEMDKAVVVRETPAGDTLRTAVVDRPVAQALALKEWIACNQPGRIARYAITPAGRMALQRMQAASENAAAARAQGMAEAPAGFRGKTASAAPGAPNTARQGRPLRYCVSDSPLAALSRRREKDGSYFLSPELVAAGERLREDFELAQMGPRTTQNWEGFLTGGVEAGLTPGDGFGGSSAARERVAGALRDLGPGLGDVALRCCCYLEGLEQTEKKLGWAARSGKVVLRIALQRLRRYYDGLGPQGGLIG